MTKEEEINIIEQKVNFKPKLTKSQYKSFKEALSLADKKWKGVVLEKVDVNCKLIKQIKELKIEIERRDDILKKLKQGGRNAKQ